jgi:hypothetical protein
VAGDKSAKRETCQRYRALGRHLLHHGQQILQLAAPLVVYAGAGAHTPKVEPHRRPAALHKGARQGLHHLVVHGAAKQWMGMGQDGHATGGRAVGQGRCIAGCLDGSCGAAQRQSFGLYIQGLLLI